MTEQQETQFGLELLRLIRRCRGIDKLVAASADLTIDEMHCLGVLFSERPSSVKTLSEMINVSPTRASKILRDLEERNYVSRSMDISDHRREHVMLTEEGKSAVQRLLALYSEVGSKMLANRPGESLVDVTQLLQMASHPD